eukprot:6489705-Amphidinium_carterae.1
MCIRDRSFSWVHTCNTGRLGHLMLKLIRRGSTLSATEKAGGNRTSLTSKLLQWRTQLMTNVRMNLGRKGTLVSFGSVAQERAYVVKLSCLQLRQGSNLWWLPGRKQSSLSLESGVSGDMLRVALCS